MHEQKKIATATGHLLDMSGCLIGTKFWETLPEEYQTVITEELKVAAKFNNAVCEENEAMYKQKLIDEGVTYYDVDKTSFIEATKDIILQYDIGAERQQAVNDIRDGKI